MSIPAPSVKANSATRKTQVLGAGAQTSLLAEVDNRLGWAVRNPIGSGQIVYISLVSLGVPITDANAGYALNAGDILTDTAVHNYCGPIFASGSGAVTVIITELF